MKIPLLHQRFLLTAISAFAFASSANAEFIGNSQGGTEFPQGAISFADAVVDYTPGVVNNQPSLPYRGSTNAVGLPDFDGITSCPSSLECSFVSLGDGGSITLAFIDNFLTGSDSDAYDLWVFEVGSHIEDTFIEVSSDGNDWLSVGKITGSTSGIDLDAHGYGSTNMFSFVRLTDDPDQGPSTGFAVGADIDAVGAVSTSPVPFPPTAWLFLAGLGYVSLKARQTKSKAT